jgi:sugar phosphate isomerase/epimerase
VRCFFSVTALFLPFFSAVSLAILGASSRAAERPRGHHVFAEDNLVAWCIVPFDANKRTPEQRAEMLERLGIRRLAYDWRAGDVPSFEEEIVACKRHGIDFFAFWSPTSSNRGYETMMRLIARYHIKPQIWMIAPSAMAGTNEERVAVNARAMAPFVEAARQLGCKFGLYNHGGWSGEPENLLAMAKWLRQHSGTEEVGIVYNFHHGHEHLDRFPHAFHQMQPFLFCVNLNGMNRNGPKILPLGQGEEDLRLLRMIHDCGYDGPIGILDHRMEVDAELSLKENLEGLAKLRDGLMNERVSATPRTEP